MIHCRTILFFGSICSLCASELPEKPDYKDYTVIKEKNAFGKLPEKKIVSLPSTKTSTPVVPKEMFVLKGISKLGDNWFVVLANRKAPREDFILKKGEENDLKIEITKIRKHPLDYTKTEVDINVDGDLQTILYDTALLSKSAGGSKHPASKKPAAKTTTAEQQKATTTRPVIRRR